MEEGNWMRAEARIKEIVEWQRETKEANILCKDGGKSLLNGIKKNTFFKKNNRGCCIRSERSQTGSLKHFFFL